MFGISGEHLLILGIVLLFFGPRRLPELGNTLGKAIRNFKGALAADREEKLEAKPDAQTAPETVAETEAEKAARKA